ncbi:unnamed protein product [Vicia faba]|uniref:Protein kinase domain-containing protein n=1 Tax=Vicia faba TaxID=3906 RepID=A0AAV0Z356_VICFA|nr:unnamed protein product [Vicia faba]
MVEDEDYRRKAKIALVAVVLLASLAVFASFVAFAYYCYIRNEVAKRRRNGHKVEDAANLNEKSDFSNLQVVAEEGLKVFTFKQLHSATGGFSKSNVVGHGGFGLVYRGVLNDGRKVGIKFMDQAGKQGEEEFKVEVELLSRLHSPYLLALLGYCSDHNHKLLVYEFMANGGLQEHLYPVSNNNSSVTSVNLDWETRLRIALEAAKGLEYLHEHLGPDRVGGHVSTRVLGTQGYVAPEYALTGHLTTKSDVYSYGVVLLELLTGRVPVDMKRPPGEGVLVTWALPLLTDREKVVKIMDPALEGQYSMKDVIQVAAIATMCVQPEADYRPLMADVVQSLVPLVKTHRSNSKVGSCSSFNSPKLSPGPAQYSVNANM